MHDDESIGDDAFNGLGVLSSPRTGQFVSYSPRCSIGRNSRPVSISHKNRPKVGQTKKGYRCYSSCYERITTYESISSYRWVTVRRWLSLSAVSFHFTLKCFTINPKSSRGFILHLFYDRPSVLVFQLHLFMSCISCGIIQSTGCCSACVYYYSSWF